MSRQSPPRVVVVGAGPGGLAAALLARARGAEVTVLEAAPRVGGRTAAIERDGFVWDTGPTFYLYPDILREIFAEAGLDFDARVPMARLDPMYTLRFDDGRSFEATPDLPRLQAEVARLSPEDAKNVPAYLAANAAKFEAFRPVLQKPFGGLGAFADLDMVRALPHLRPWATVDADLGRYFRDPDVRLAFSFQSKYLGMSPFKCPSLFTILAHIEYAHGVFHPIGGCNAIPRAMAQGLAELGVEVRTAEPVEAMEFEGRRATAVRTARGTYPADAVVVNADFAHAMRTMVPDRLRRRWTDAKIEAKDYSCSTFMLYLGLEGRLDLPHHTIFLAGDYARNIREIEEGLAPQDASVYVQNPSVTDPTLAPPGHSALYVLVPVGNLARGAVDWAREAPAYREATLDRVAKLAGRDIRPLIRSETVVTPLDWQAQGIFRGATFNLAHNLGQMLHNRPRNRFEDVDGVYLTGGGTHPGSGLPTIFESARIAVRLMADDLGLSRPLAAE